jgi:hypothetical protein
MGYSVLSIIDEIGEVNQELGVINNIFLKKIIFLGEQNNLRLLGAMDENDCNIFNQFQLKELNKEIELINNDLSVQEQQELEHLKIIIDKCLNAGEYNYLKICNFYLQDKIYAPFQQFFE